jgi:hypothetical protein
MEDLEDTITDSRISIFLIHRLNSIVNAIECQVEEGERDRAVLEPLFDALSELVRLCPKGARTDIKKACQKCRKKILGDRTRPVE